MRSVDRKRLCGIEKMPRRRREEEERVRIVERKMWPGIVKSLGGWREEHPDGKRHQQSYGFSHFH
jgi:hypothetical protein